jgi:hypothetical protein
MAFYNHECAHIVVGMDAVAGRTECVPGEHAVVCLGFLGEMGEFTCDDFYKRPVLTLGPSAHRSQTSPRRLYRRPPAR